MTLPLPGRRSRSASCTRRLARQCLIALGLFAGSAPGPSSAQTGIQGIPQARPDQKTPTAPLTPTRPIEAVVPRDPVAAITPFTLASVALDGSSIAEADLAAAYWPFVGKVVGNAELTQITNALATVYGRSDIALFTVLVPNQTFAGGRLRLVVIEGYVGAVEVRGKLRRQRAGLLRAYLRQLERERCALLLSRVRRLCRVGHRMYPPLLMCSCCCFSA